MIATAVSGGAVTVVTALLALSEDSAVTSTTGSGACAATAAEIART